MDKDIKVSVIIPVYNAEKYLGECLDSILRQTLDGIQVIIMNDGSTDNSLDVMESYAKKYPDVIEVYSQKNGGQSLARNNCHKYVKGKYMAYVDADDYILDDYFQTLYDTAEKENSDLVICSYDKFLNTGEIVLHRNSKDWEIAFSDNLIHVFQYSPCAKLYLSSMIIDNKLEFGVGEKMEDGPFAIITGSIAKNPVVLDYFGYKYRMYDESTMGQIRKKGIQKSEPAQQFPYKGLEDAIKKVKVIRGEENDQVLEYVIFKALAGFTFLSSKKSGKETQKYICEYDKMIISKYFPDYKKNPYLKLKWKSKLPYVHQLATVLLKWTYRGRVLYPFTRAYTFISK